MKSIVVPCPQSGQSSRVMFIRQTKTRSTSDGKSYFTHRLVESKRVGTKVRQRTLLNLGTNFDLPRDLWPELCIRIEQILNCEQPLFTSSPAIEKSALGELLNDDFAPMPLMPAGLSGTRRSSRATSAKAAPWRKCSNNSMPRKAP